jgi:septal ring factor EnvC (AmiA/AmiB activator)
MVRSPAEENERLQRALSEKNHLIDKQTGIINQQIGALSQLGELKKRNQCLEHELKETRTLNESLTDENARLRAFRDKIQSNYLCRIMKWFKR